MHSSPRTLTGLSRLVLAGVLGARALFAQGHDLVVLQRIKAVAESTDYRVVQTRRVLTPTINTDGTGPSPGKEWVGAIEQVVHRGDRGSALPERFSLELRAFEGVSMAPHDLARRQLLYQGQAGYLFRFHSFRVLDAQLAASNYIVQAMTVSCDRAGRRCNRLAVISRTADRPNWLLDLDATIGLPLYCAEFAPNGELVAELEVSHVTFGAAAQVPPGDAWAWSPRMGVVEFATAEEARSRAAGVSSISIASTDIGVGYLLDHARVISDPLTAEQALVQVFHDGIDALFVQQRPQPPLKELGHTARHYSEHGVQQCLFQQRLTEFLIAGRNANLRRIATRIHRAAVSTL